MSTVSLAIFRQGFECQYENLWIYIARWIKIIVNHDNRLRTLLEETAYHKNWLPRLHACAVVENLTQYRDMQIRLTRVFLRDKSYRVQATAIAGCLLNALDELIPGMQMMLKNSRQQRCYNDINTALYYLENKIAWDTSTEATLGILDGILRIKQI